MGLSGGSLDALRRVGVRRRGCLQLDQLDGRRVRLGIVEELADASLGERGHRSVCASDGERWLRATWWRGDEACGRRVSRVAAPHAPARAREDELFAREEGRKVPDVSQIISAAIGLLPQARVVRISCLLQLTTRVVRVARLEGRARCRPARRRSCPTPRRASTADSARAASPHVRPGDGTQGGNADLV